MTLLHTLRKQAQKALGIDFQRANAWTMPFLRLVETLKQHRVGAVIDIGANDGGFAADLFEAGFGGKVISFEPLPDAWDALKRRAATVGSRWQVGPRVALSDRAGQAEFNVAGNSVSSSLLRMMGTHEQAAPASKTVSTIPVETARLDDIIGTLDVEGPAYLKVDVQGAEIMVLDGASASLRHQIVGVQLEMALADLYEGQARPEQLAELLKAAGYTLWDVIPGFRDPKSFRLLQYDGVFYR